MKAIPSGYDNNQFLVISGSWAEYCVTSVSIEFIPTAASGYFGSTAMVSAIDESGVLQGN